VCLGIRSGIGSGVIVDGQLLRGANNLAGEIGHWTCPNDLATSAAAASSTAKGQPPTIEDVASVTALLADAARRLAAGQPSSLGRPGDRPTIAEVLVAVGRGDTLARTLVERAAAFMPGLSIQLALLLDPQRVVVAGPLVESDAYFAALHQAASRLGGPLLKTDIVRSTLGAFAGALGAAALAFDHWKRADDCCFIGDGDRRAGPGPVSFRA